MLAYIVVAAAVLLVSMMIQAIALAATVRFVSWPLAGPAGLNFWRSVGVATVVMLILLTALLVQIAVWAGAFVICGAMPDFETAFYHSAVNYTTLGYGDIVMPRQAHARPARGRQRCPDVRPVGLRPVRRAARVAAQRTAPA